MKWSIKLDLVFIPVSSMYEKREKELLLDLMFHGDWIKGMEIVCLDQ
jgi:hypothetical protein